MKKYANDRKVAMETLKTFDPAKVKLVSVCRSKMLSTYSENDEENHAVKLAEIERDYRCQAAEDWEDLSVDEADKLFDDILATLDIIHLADAIACC